MAKPVKSILEIWDGAYWEPVLASGATDTATATAINNGGGYSDSATSLTVDSTAGILAGNYIQIGNEVLQVGTVASGTVLNPVVRSRLSTTAASMADDAVVTLVSVGPNALFKLELKESYGAPVACDISLFNFPHTAGGTEGYIEDKYSSYLEEYDRIRIVDDYSKAILFYGRIYRKEIEFDKQFGSVIHITAFDALKELAENRLEGDSAKFTGQTRRSGVIAKMVEGFTYQNAAGTNLNLATADTQKFATSVATIPSGDKYDFSTGKATGLSALRSLANIDPHTAGAAADTPSSDFGYSYFVDNGFTSSLKSTSYTSAISALNYFQRGSLPNSTTPQNFYKISYGVPESDGDSTNSYTTTVNTMNSFQVTKQYTDVSTAISVTFKDKDGGVNTMTCYRADVDSVAGTNSTAFAYETLFGSAAAPIALEDSPTISIDSSTSSYTKQVVGRLIYINATSGNDKFIVFTLDSGYVPEDIHESILSAASKTSDFIRVDVLGGNTGSAGDPVSQGANRFTVEATSDVDTEILRTTSRAFDATSVTNETRMAIGQMFVESQTTSKPIRADLNIIDYPFARITSAISSRAGNVLTLPVDIYDRGARKGMVVRQLKSGEETGNYGYISAIVGGGTPTVTVVLSNAAGTQTAGTSLPWADSDTFTVYIPIRPGFQAYLTNEPSNLTVNGMITELTYSEGMGVQTTSLGLVTGNIAALEETGGSVQVGTTSDTPVVSDSSKRASFSVTAGATTAFVSLPSTSDDYRRLNWAAGTLTVGTKNYEISAGNTYDALSSAHLTWDQWYVLYFNKQESTTEFKLSSLTNLPYHVDLISVALFRASSTGSGYNTSGNATARFDMSDVIFSAEAIQSIDVGDISDGAIGSAKFVRGSQPFSMTNTAAPATNVWSSSSYNAVAWAASTLTYSDGDTLTVNADSASSLDTNKTYWAYVDTTNGNITLTATAGDAISDTKILVALIRVGADTEPAATIAPLGTQIPAISTSGLAANAIISSTIASDALDAHTITLAGGGKLISSAGAVRDGANNHLSTNFTSGQGVLLDQYGILGNNGGTGADYVQFYADASDGKFYAGAGTVVIDEDGITIADDSSSFANSRFKLADGTNSTLEFYCQGTPSNNYMVSTTQSSDSGVGYDTDYAHDLYIGASNVGKLAKIIPSANDKVSLGDASKRFLTGYFTDIKLGSSETTFTKDILFRDTVTANGMTLHPMTVSTDTNIGASAYGIIRYEKDGNGDGADTLGFLAGQAFGGRTGIEDGANTPTTTNHGSSFYSMLSEIDTSARVGDGSGYVISRLIFEPIVDWHYNNNDTQVDTTDGYYNYAYLGYHNWLYSLNCYYGNFGAGSAANPGITLGSDSNTGFYNIASGHTGYSDDGTLRVNFGGHTFATNDSSGASTVNPEFSVAGTGAFSSYLYVGELRPENDNISDIGTSTRRFDNIFATNDTISTSDIRVKEDIQTTTLGLDFINDLNPVSYKWIDKREGTDKLDQTHYGIIAQEVIETLKKYGIDSLDDFGGIFHDGEDENYYGARYSEFIPILMKAVQELSAEIKELKEKN